MIYRLLFFLVLNFAALAIGGLFTGDGVPSTWYQELSKAPWTPPGWVFGAAWTLIMICFAVFMAYAFRLKKSRFKLIWVFLLQWVLNIIWNPVFFYYHEILFAMIIISFLTILMVYLSIVYAKNQRLLAVWLLPYVLWLLIASSLNGYILFNN